MSEENRSIIVRRGGQEFGPYTREEAMRYLNAALLTRTDIAWFEGESSRAGCSLAGILGGSAPPPPPKLPGSVRLSAPPRVRSLVTAKPGRNRFVVICVAAAFAVVFVFIGGGLMVPLILSDDAGKHHNLLEDACSFWSTAPRVAVQSFVETAKEEVGLDTSTPVPKQTFETTQPTAHSVGSAERTKRVQEDVQAIKTLLQLYESLNGFYPTTQQGLRALVVQPDTDPRPARWYQLFKEVPKDPWGSEYIYRCPGQKNPNGYDLFSAGRDRKPDTADDEAGELSSSFSELANGG